MNIAILSGKGGTGKTTVSTNLALTLGIPYVDCDVEEPNGFLFLSPEIKEKKDVAIKVPAIDKSKCSYCGACTKVCQFHALAKAGKDIVLFEKLCHGCGACELVCTKEAISYRDRTIGYLEHGNNNEIACYRGVLNVGEPMAVPVIRILLKELPKEDHSVHEKQNNKDYLIDCPPGTSCNVVAVLKYADAAILVTEPSRFGLHDMKLAVELVKQFRIPFGIIINKDDGTDNIVKSYCQNNDLPLLGVIPYSKEAAAFYSKGRMLCGSEQYQGTFQELAARVREVFHWSL